MPDIDFQKIELNLIPKKGDEPVVFYASQYETARPFIADLFWGESEFAPGVDYYAEIDIRKNDDNLVVITDDVSIDNNEVSVILPVQAVTCIGKNLGQVKIYSGEDHLIAALNFILEVQADPLAGGVTSETAIDNLTQQIEDIAQEVIGEDYYDKTEVDALLADKADVSDLPDMTDYYTKSQVYNKTEADTLLADKVNNYQLNDTPVLGSVSAAQVVNAWDSQHGYYKLIKNAALNTYSKSEIDAIIDNIFPTLTASGSTASFNTALTKPLVSITTEEGATEITACGINICDEVWETGNISGTNGQNYNDPNNIRNVNYIPVKPSTSYYFKTPSQVNIAWYDSSKAFLRMSYPNQSIITTNADVAYFRIATRTYGSVFNNDICFNYPSTETAYYDFNGVKVPVADADTIVTQSGTNNIYADVGDVSVSYKYMSM